MAWLTSTTLYVGNISFFTTETQVHEAFARCGTVKRIIMGLDRCVLPGTRVRGEDVPIFFSLDGGKEVGGKLAVKLLLCVRGRGGAEDSVLFLAKSIHRGWVYVGGFRLIDINQLS